ncbi:hypothetical protein BFP97_00440 [Roseivirga sp. 4D4]|uniref:TolB family protein n=1 Tax=Roseivirga sp. 4D4 TaxID=1889784 RepID=UPI0008536D96|nr:PD40 domain-containing protein [Roseivirga sp. 4D4]OEK00073.1 hypothetical protein BFP97_00440 [Roseivirga sp. 4D4]
MKGKYLLFTAALTVFLHSCQTDDAKPIDVKPSDLRILFIENSEGAPFSKFTGELKCIDPEGISLTEVTHNTSMSTGFISTSNDYSKVTFHASVNSPCLTRDIFSLDPITLSFERKTNSIARALTRGCQNLTTYSDPWLSPDGSAIAVVKSGGNRNDAVILDMDGQEEINLASIINLEIKDNYKPRWSPDGTKVAFATRHFTNDEKTEALWRVCVINRDGSNPIFIGSFSEAITTPIWSPDGSQIVYEVFKQDRTSLFGVDFRTSRIMNSDGTDDRLLAPQFESVFVENHAWFKDNKRLIANVRQDPNSAKNEIVIINTELGTHLQLTDMEPLEKSSLSLSPDEEWVLYVGSDPTKQPNSDNVWKIRVDGSENKRLTNINHVRTAQWVKVNL